MSGGGTAATSTGITITGAQVLQGAGLLAGIGVFCALPKQGGTPYSVVEENGSIGYYDGNGNLSYRRDISGKPHYIKALGDKFLPHTHIYEWKFIKGAWRIVKKIVLPY